MATQKKELKPWDIHFCDYKGDETEEAVYTAVGRALSAWNLLEQTLAELFGRFVVYDRNPMIVMYAYGAVRTFEGRTSMLKKVSSAFFVCCINSPEKKKLQDKWKILLNTKCKAAGERRNDIAHGVLLSRHEFERGAPKNMKFWYYLGPSSVDSSKMEFWGKASFAYSSKELYGHAKLFEDLAIEVLDVSAEVLRLPSPYAEKPE